MYCVLKASGHKQLPLSMLCNLYYPPVQCAHRDHSRKSKKGQALSCWEEITDMGIETRPPTLTSRGCISAYCNRAGGQNLPLPRAWHPDAGKTDAGRHQWTHSSSATHPLSGSKVLASTEPPELGQNNLKVQQASWGLMGAPVKLNGHFLNPGLIASRIHRSVRCRS
jgi:hypothetical protein